MFDAVRNNPKIAQIILFILMVPFALFGVDYYFRGGPGRDEVASVDGGAISAEVLQRTVSEQQDRLRRSLGNAYDPSMFEGQAFRASVLDNLVQQRVLLNVASKEGFAAPDAQVRDAIARIEAFREGGRFSKERYEAALRNQGMNPAYFEMRMREDFIVEQVESAYGPGALVSRAAAERLARASEQRREVSVVTLLTEAYLDQVTVDEAAIKRYYDEHKAEFEIPEQLRADYVVLSVDGLAAAAKPTEEMVRKQYEENRSRYQQPEERQASHILVKVDANAPEADKAAARARAEEILKQVKAAPDSFAAVAREKSQDPGSASLGGDLGMISRGSMVKPFEDAVFAMKPGDIVGPVETEFGYHVIKLTALKPAAGKTLEEARPIIEQELRRQQAGRQFAETAEQLSNLVYEHPENLKAAADALKLEIRRSPWLTRQGGGEDAMLKNPKLLAALFTPEVLSGERNTDAIEVDPNTIVAAHMAEHKPAAMRPLEEVKGQIEGKLRREQASALAQKAGQAKLAELQQGKDAGLAWPKPVKASFADPGGLSAPAVRAAFRVDAAKLPGYAGITGDDGSYNLLRVSAVEDPSQLDPGKKQQVVQQIGDVLAEAEATAALASLRAKAKVQFRQRAAENP